MPLTSDKYKLAEANLPEDLKPVFKRFVGEYEYLIIKFFREFPGHHT